MNNNLYLTKDFGKMTNNNSKNYLMPNDLTTPNCVTNGTTDKFNYSSNDVFNSFTSSHSNSNLKTNDCTVYTNKIDFSNNNSALSSKVLILSKTDEKLKKNKQTFSKDDCLNQSKYSSCTTENDEARNNNSINITNILASDQGKKKIGDYFINFNKIRKIKNSNISNQRNDYSESLSSSKNYVNDKENRVVIDNNYPIENSTPTFKSVTNDSDSDDISIDDTLIHPLLPKNKKNDENYKINLLSNIRYPKRPKLNSDTHKFLKDKSNFYF